MPARPHLAHEDLLRLRTHRPIDHRVRHYTIDSHALGVRKGLYVALPPGYHAVDNLGVRYPVVYLLRGHEREWVHRRQDNSRRGRTVIDVYRRLLDSGAVPPVILVIPGISSEDHRIPGLLVNFRAPELAHGAPGIGTGRFEDYFLDELVPFVDTRFRTIAHRRGRAVDGFSLGGLQSIMIAARRPDLFCSAGSFDGTFFYATERGRSVRRADRVIHNPILDPSFGLPRQYGFIAEHSPANLFLLQARADLASVQWLIRSGPESAEPWQANFYRAQHVLSIMAHRGLENGIAPVLENAVHEWRWADLHMMGTLPLHAAALEKPSRSRPAAKAMT